MKQNEKQYDKIHTRMMKEGNLFGDETNADIPCEEEHVCRDFDELFYRLARSDFRRRFCLKQAEEEGPEEEEAAWDTDYRIVCVRELMRTMHPTTRYVLEACYLDRKKYKEVAGELGISMSMVKKHLSKALRLIRERLLKK